jgi:tRNA(Arg) A34 adenosine deaminase TadA
MTDEDYMRLAIRKARDGIAADQSPFGACVVRDGQILACEHNLVWRTTDATAHAEVTAIRAACRAADDVKLSGATIYSTTEPCPMCFAAIHWAGIARIVFGASIADARRAGFGELTLSNIEMKRIGGSPVQVAPPLLSAEAVQLFQEWLANPRHRTY